MTFIVESGVATGFEANDNGNRTNGAWIVNELGRIERLRSIRRPNRQAGRAILYRGELTPVHVDEDRNRGGANTVMFKDRQLVILRSTTSRTAPSVSLENWLRSRHERKSCVTSTC